MSSILYNRLRNQEFTGMPEADRLTVHSPILNSEVRIRFLSPEDVANLQALPEPDRTRETLLMGLADPEVVINKLASAVKGSLRNAFIDGGNCLMHKMVTQARQEIADAIIRKSQLNGTKFTKEETVEGCTIRMSPDGVLTINSIRCN